MWAGLDIIPHSPTFVEGQKYHPKAIEHLQALGRQYEEIGGVVVVSTHFFEEDFFPVNNSDPLQEFRDWQGFAGLAAIDDRHWDGLPFLADSLQRAARAYGVPVGMKPGPIDHSVWAPLRWMFPPHIPMPVLPVGISDLGARTHYRFGQAIRQAVVEAPKPIAVLVASNLTHRTDWLNWRRKNLPREGQAFDAAVLAGLEEGDWSQYDNLGTKIKSAARPDMANRLWAVVRGLNSGLRGEIRHYSAELGAFGMAVVHYDTGLTDAGEGAEDELSAAADAA